MEGQMSEDFFEKLVDEDNIGSARSGFSFIENKESEKSDNAKAFSNLSIEEVHAAKGDSGDNGERESGGGVVSVSSDGYRDNETDEGSVLVIPDNVVQSNDAALEAIGESDLQKGSNGVTSGMDVKEVDWSSFNSASHIDSGSISDFFNELGVYSGDLNGRDTGGYEVVSNDAVNVPVSMSGGIRSSTSVKHEEGGRYYGTQTENAIEEQDLPSSQNWGDIYPGWRYDPCTGQWLKIEGNESTVSTQENFYPSFASASDNVVTEQRSDAYCFQLPLAEYKMGNVSNWDHCSQQKVEYPAHMVFDPQYPGWYYDTIVQEWRLLESYRAATTQPTNFSHNQRSQDRAFTTGSELLTEGNSIRDNFGQMRKFESQGLTSQVEVSLNNYNQQNRNTWQTTSLPNSGVMDIIDNQVSHIPHAPTYCASNSADQHNQQMSYRAATTQPTNFSHNQRSQDRAFTTGSELLTEGNHSVHDNFGQMRKFESQGLTSQVEVSLNNYNQQNMNTWQTAPLPNSGVIDIIDNQVSHIPYAPNYSASNSGDQQNQQTWLPEQTSHSFASANSISGYQACIPGVNFCEPGNQHKPEPSGPSPQMQYSPVNFDSQKSPDFSKPVQSGGQFPHASSEGRSPAGRPPHALVTFGFGGKLIVMKDNSSFSNSAYGSKNSADGIISVLNLMDVVMDKSDASSIGLGACDYFHAICQQSLPGPLVGGNVGSREVTKWVDEKIASCESPDKDYRRGELLRRLFSLLKIGCQYRGKLRSPFGTDQSLKESDCPESAVAQLFASAKRNVGPYGAFSRCLQNFPSEREIQATALEVQKLLISGRLKDALQSAQEGQLWGPALALAAQLGDQFYSDTVKQMALCQLVVGSPLRTIFLLVAGQPADVFSNTTCTSSLSSLPGAVNVSQHSSQVCNGASCALDNWEENLAIITANRTKDDELVIIHFGDCLLKERGEIIAAHICYLVAETNFESYSDSARVCLIGADHWNFPRTYASPEAIQRTELYEYSKVLGNSQCIVLPFQPYKLVYAHMLAEVGKVSDSLKYCQAILKCLKPCRSPEVDAWKNLALSLEERIKVHQQGGYSANLAPAKLVGKLFNLFDSTSHRVVGGLPPPTPTTSHGSSQQNDGPRVSNSQSTMAMSSLMPSASTEPISEWQGGSNKSRHYRSISEPDFGKSPIKDGSSPDIQGNTPGTGGSSRFGRFRSQLFQKTVGLVLRSRPDRQAKLGEANRFYYDEKLKRWVEEGAENLSEEATLPPPPSNAAFQNIMLDNTSKDERKLDNSQGNGGSHHESQSPLELNLGKQPIPCSSDQLSARGRMGIRARYVDTFNKGGAAPPNLFQSPSLPAGKPGVVLNTKFFIPTPMALGDETVQTTGDLREAVVDNETPSTSVEMISSPPTSTSSMTMHRVPSMDNIRRSRTGAMENGKGSLPPHSRRTVSWSGGFYDTSNTTNTTEIRPLGEAQGVPQPLLIPGNSSPMQFSMNTGNLGNDLHEVEL